MFDSRRRMPVLLVMPAAVAVAVAGVAGCGASHNSGSSSSSGSSQAGASSTQSAGVVAQTGTYTAAKLRSALLTKVNGTSAATPAQSGNYSSLPDVKASQQSMHSVSVTPKACAEASMTGFNPAELADAPAAAVAFHVGGNGVSEVLISPTSSVADGALASKIPAGCDHYQATVDGKTYQYSVTESSLSGIGQQAKALNVQTAGYPDDDVWSVLYRGSGFVGAVTVVGPNASKAVVQELGQQAYKYAAKSLS
jgi:hypothetical protein